MLRLACLVLLSIASVALAEQPAVPGPRASWPTLAAYNTYDATLPSARVEAAAAQQLFSSGDYKRAARKLEIALKEEPRNSGLLDELGLTYERLAESSSFPSVNQGRADKMFRRSIAADRSDPRPVQHLIALLLDPPNQCHGDLSEVKNLIQQLSAVDPVAAKEATQNLEWTASESPTLAERFVCAPHQAVRILKRALP